MSGKSRKVGELDEVAALVKAWRVISAGLELSSSPGHFFTKVATWSGDVWLFHIHHLHLEFPAHGAGVGEGVELSEEFEDFRIGGLAGLFVFE